MDEQTPVPVQEASEPVPVQEAYKPATMQEAYEPDESKKIKWSAFLETTVADFFTGYKLEKLTLEDGNGNKAKLSRTKDNGIKIEQSSTTIL